jgi:DNA-binding transcriptional regulator GbsR (MarR family)
VAAPPANSLHPIISSQNKQTNKERTTNMKKIIAIIAVALPLVFSAHAQFIVEDPANLAEQIANEAENIAQFVSMVDNQVQQIQQLSDQLSEFKNYEKLFGNPSQVALSMVPALNSDLQSTEPIQSLENLVSSANGNYALTYNDNGIYATVGVNFQTPRGQTVQRPADEYKKYAAINETANNFITVADNATQRRATIKNQIAQTTKQLQSATTDAEVQKLQGVLTSLNADLASTDDEVNQAASSAMVQDIQNRNDQQKQIQALTEQQNAEFEESVSNYAAKFQLLNAPVQFPTP